MFRKKPQLLRLLHWGAVSLLLLATLLWLGFIFGNSLKDATASGAQSGQVHEIVNEVASSVGIKEPVPESTVRNMAHFTEFSLLGVLLCLDLWALGVSPLTPKRRGDALWLLCALPTCFLLASVDEGLQLFSEGRACDFADVLLDTAGAAIGIALFFAFFLLLRLTFGKKKPNT